MISSVPHRCADWTDCFGPVPFVVGHAANDCVYFDRPGIADDNQFIESTERRYDGA